MTGTSIEAEAADVARRIAEAAKRQLTDEGEARMVKLAPVLDAARVLVAALHQLGGTDPTQPIQATRLLQSAQADILRAVSAARTRGADFEDGPL